MALLQMLFVVASLSIIGAHFLFDPWKDIILDEESCQVYGNRQSAYIMNPGYPKPLKKLFKCSLRLKIAKSIRQVRLDFINFNLAEAKNVPGSCEDDEMIVHNGATKELKICGEFSKQHLYYDVNDKSADLYVNITLKRLIFDRSWLIKVIQVEPSKQAKPGCLQYYQTQQATLYPIEHELVGRDVVNQNNRICIQLLEETCSVKYDPCTPINISDELEDYPHYQGLTLPVLTLVPFSQFKKQYIVKDIYKCIKYYQNNCHKY